MDRHRYAVEVAGIQAHSFGIVRWPADARNALFRRLIQYLSVMYTINLIPRVLLMVERALLQTLAVRYLLGVSRSSPPLRKTGHNGSNPINRVGKHSCWFEPGIGHMIAYDDGNANRTQPLPGHPLSPSLKYG